MKIFPNRYRPIQYINKIPFLIHAIVEIEKVESKVNEMKEYLGCDTAFKNLKENVYYFCEEIKEVEEITEE
jgi:hypothetical protein